MRPNMFRNKILCTLDERSIHQLRLSPAQMTVGQELQEAGAPISMLFFPETGMASSAAAFSDGSQVEVGTFGYDSLIGAQALMGATHSLHRIYIQIAGHAYVSRLKAALREFQACGLFHQVALRHIQAQLVQATQLAACNAKHNVEERLASRLMLCCDRTQCHTFPISHHFLASMLGSTRSTASIAAGALKSEGLINYSRGTMQVLDPEALEKRACECYCIVRDHLAASTDLAKAFSA